MLQQTHTNEFTQTWSSTPRASENRLIRVVFDADLRCSHEGLTAIAKNLKLKLDELELGEFVAFINSKKTMIKLYAAGNTIAHFKTPDGRQLNLKVLALIPKFFNGRELKYDDALKEVITKEIRR